MSSNQNLVENFVILICVGRMQPLPTQVDDKTLIFDVPDPHLVNAITIAFLPDGLSLLGERELTVHAATEIETTFNLISTLTTKKPSVILYKPFGLIPQTCSMGKIKLSIAAKSLCDSFKSVDKNDEFSEDKPLTIKLAENFVNYVKSFERAAAEEAKYAAISKQLCENWCMRFKHKWKHDSAFRAKFS